MVFFLIFLIVAIVLGLIGAVVAGLGYLLAIAVVIFLADVTVAISAARQRGRRPVR
jgi:hypothetical protein